MSYNRHKFATRRIATHDHSVYIVRNTVNGKQYVGQTVVPAKRLGAHLRGASGSLALNGAVQKYGRTSFSFRVLAVGMSKACADDAERGLIQALRTRAPHGYNLTDGGDGMTGHKFSATSRAKMSAAKIGKKMSDEHCKKIRAALQKFWGDPERRAQHAQAQRARLASPEVRARMRAGAKSRKMTDQQKYDHAQASKRLWLDPVMRKRMQDCLSDPAMIRRRNVAIRAAHSTPEARAAASARQKARMADPEVRLRLSQAAKRRKEAKHAYA